LIIEGNLLKPERVELSAMFILCTIILNWIIMLRDMSTLLRIPPHTTNPFLHASLGQSERSPDVIGTAVYPIDSI
jgi:hypothetical protein